MQLPEAFSQRMKSMLGEEFDEFLAAYDQPRTYGLRVNTRKISVEDFLRIAPFHLSPIPWTENGFFYQEDDLPSKHPYYFAGLYYLQEPSAMTPASRLFVAPGMKVLDLCAAPGGKATELGSRLKGEGLLVANDISAPRMKALMKNIEVFGITNSFLTNEDPDRLAEAFPEFFDRILVDAPCSGEGMFRKEAAMAEAWNEEKPAACAAMQDPILNAAARMLKKGGSLLYSTCTFAPIEDEGSVSRFLEAHPDFSLEEMEPYEGFDAGRPAWGSGDPSLAKTVRIWPQKMQGEGHYLALMKKEGIQNEAPESKPPVKKGKKNRTKKAVSGEAKAPEDLMTFLKNVRRSFPAEAIQIHGDYCYYSPTLPDTVRGLKFVRSGLLLGELKKGRFEPSQPLAMALSKDEYAFCIDFAADDPRVIRYLKGETLQLSEGEAGLAKGWVLVCVDGYPLGWGKLVGQTLKNKYLSGWRMN